MIIFTPISYISDVENTSIGYPRYSEIVVDTDLPIFGNFPLSGGLPQKIAIKPALWINPTQLPETPGTLPTQGYWDFETDAGTLLGTDYSMGFVAGTNANNQLNGYLTIRFDNFAGIIRLTLKWRFINWEDTLTYLIAAHLNQFKLLKDATSNSVILDNSQIDVYSAPRVERLGLWWIEPTDVRSLVRLELPEQLKFFGDYPGFWEQNGFTFGGCLGGVLQNLQNFDVTFHVDKFAAPVPTDAYWLIFRTDSQDNTVPFKTNSQTNKTGFEVAPPAASPFTAWDLDNSDARIVTTTPFAVFSGATYETIATIDPTKLTIGAKYRFIVFLADGADTWSFISDEITISDCSCFIAPTLVESSISDYITLFGSNVNVTPQERLKSCFELDSTPYDAARPCTLIDGLQSIQITFYSINAINPNVKDIYEEYSINKNSLNTFNVPTSNPSGAPKQWSFIATGTQLRVCQDFRVSYEGDQKNLRSVNQFGANLGQLSTMDWTGRTVFIEYKLLIRCGDYEDIITITQRINVHNYAVIDPSLTIADSMNWEVRDVATGNILTEICYPKTLQICSGAENSTDAGGNMRFISGMDLKPYSKANFVEDDGAGCPAGLLPAILNPIISLQDCTYNQTAAQSACFDFVVPDVRGKTIRISAIKKSFAPQTGCLSCDYTQADESNPYFLLFRSRMTSPPAIGTARSKIYCWTIQLLQANGFIGAAGLCDCLYFPAAHNSSASLLNWANNTGAFDLMPFNGISADFIAERGYQKFTYGVGKFMQTNFKPAIDGVAYNAGGSHFSIISGNNYEPMGFFEGSPYHLLIQNDTANVMVLDGGLISDSVGYAQPSSNMATCSRNGTERRGYTNGNFTTAKTYSVDIATGCIIIHGYSVSHVVCSPFAVNDVEGGGYTSTCSGSCACHDNSYIPFVSIGGYLTQAKVRALHCIVRCYLLAIGFEYTHPCVQNAWDESTYCP